MNNVSTSAQQVLQIKNRVTPPNEQLNSYLFEITTGILLGDGNLQKPKSCRYHRLRFSQNQKRHDYVDWLFSQYKNDSLLGDNYQYQLIRQNQPFEFNYVTPKTEKKEIGFGFQTRISSAFNDHENIFYSQNSTKKKLCFDLNVFNTLLTPIALSYWFMDDGTWPNKNARSFVLCTHGFTMNEVEFFSNLLNNKFDLITTVRFNKTQPIISISAKCFERFKALIAPEISRIPSMINKFPI